MKLVIKKAERYQRKAKIAIMGPSGSGKTMSALRIARGLVGASGRILVGDTERSSSTLYAATTDFDHVDIPDYEYETFLELIRQASAAKYDGLIIDSASHAWEAFLEMHEQESARQRNSFTAWAKITPKYNQLISAIINFPGHCIATMRSKTEYVIEQNEKGKQSPKKVGLAPIMRPGSEYEFDVVATVDLDHRLVVEKSRIDWLADKVISKPDEKLGAKIAEWLQSGKPLEVTVAEQSVTPGKKWHYCTDAVGSDKIDATNAWFEKQGAKYSEEFKVWESAKELKGAEKLLISEQEMLKRAVIDTTVLADTPAWMEGEAQTVTDAEALAKLNELKAKTKKEAA